MEYEKKPYKKSVAIGRSVIAYPPPADREVIIGLTKSKPGTSRSAVLTDIIKKYVAGLPPEQVQALRALAKNGY